MKTRQQSKKKNETLEKPSKGKQKAKASGSTTSKAQSAHSNINTDQMVYIRVLYSDIDNTTITNVPVDPSAPRHLYLIEGTLNDIARYAGETVDWIIKVSNLICDPSGAGHVYTHTKGTPSYCYNKDRDASWRQVALGDPLLAGIYEFVANDQRDITLSKFCERHIHSLTSRGATATTSASTFRQNIDKRDVACVVTKSGTASSLTASHLVPKRVGDEGAKAIMERFVGVGESRDIHKFHPSLGILLFKTLDALVDCNELGFYHETNNVYRLHYFGTDILNIVGCDADLEVFANSNVPLLHGYSVTLSTHRRNIKLPPTGIFNWHYLQCVLLRFATPQYRQLPGISFFIYPFKTADDDESDDEFEDDVNDEPPYPSYHFDRIMTLRQEKLWEQEQLKEVAQWASKVASEAE